MKFSLPEGLQIHDGMGLEELLVQSTIGNTFEGFGITTICFEACVDQAIKIVLDEKYEKAAFESLDNLAQFSIVRKAVKMVQDAANIYNQNLAADLINEDMVTVIEGLPAEEKSLDSIGELKGLGVEFFEKTLSKFGIEKTLFKTLVYQASSAILNKKYPGSETKILDRVILINVLYQAIQIVHIAANLCVEKLSEAVLEAKIKQIQNTNALKTE
jgi:hypothetical protein